MIFTYSDAYNNAQRKRIDLDALINSGGAYSKFVNIRGRYIASLQVLLKHAIKEGKPASTIASIKRELQNQLLEHKKMLNSSEMANKRGGYTKNGKYSMIKELSLGMKSLMNSIKLAKMATTDKEKSDARKQIAKDIGKNFKNLVKAPLVMTTKILSSGITAAVIFTPISIGLSMFQYISQGISAGFGLSENPTPRFDNSNVTRMSNGFRNFMSRLNTGIKTRM